MRALIIVDAQNDFCPGGSLPTERGSDVAKQIGAFQIDGASNYEVVVATKDWHIDPGDHFSKEPDFKTSWPVHCLADSEGADFHPAIHEDRLDEVFLKGEYAAAYSGFEGHAASDGETSLRDWLKGREILSVDIVGIATDYCVKATAADAIKNGFETRILTSMVAPVDYQDGAAALKELQAEGAILFD